MLLGIDIGTSGTKALLISEKGQVLGRGYTEYGFETPRPLWSEQNPELWWQGAQLATRQALQAAEVRAGDVTGIGLSGQMHGLTLLDAHGQVLRPAILWNDQRTAAECRTITEKAGGVENLLALIANPVLPGFTAPKLEWVRRHEPEIYTRIHHILLPKDYVRFRMTGEFATEVSDASGTAWLDVHHRRWSEKMLELLELPIEWLPRVGESVQVTGQLNAAGAAALGLQPGIPVVGGGGDQAAGAVGSGIVQPGQVSAALGTSGVIFAYTDQPAVDPQGRLHTFCHAVPGSWHVMGVMLSAGGSLRWMRDNLGGPENRIAALTGGDAYDTFIHEAALAPAGSEGLFFLPYLTGERTPYPDPDARGGWLGLTVRHNKRHMVRALIEGVTYGLRDSLELVRGLGIAPVEVRASGGGARSPLWLQIMADIFGTPVAPLLSSEGAAMGAALLAGTGTGTFQNLVEAALTAAQVGALHHPQQAAQAIYQKGYQVYHSLYPTLQSTFRDMALLT